MAAYDQKDLEKWKKGLLNAGSSQSSKTKLIAIVVIGFLIIAGYLANSG